MTSPFKLLRRFFGHRINIFFLGTLLVEEMDEFSEKLRRGGEGGVISDPKKFIADFVYNTRQTLVMHFRKKAQ